MKVEHKFYFSNDHIFSAVMKNADICKGILNRIIPDKNVDDVVLHEDMESLFSQEGDGNEVETQKTISFDAETRGVRLDAFFKDEDTWYNIEMECTKDRFLPLRFRYYGSTMDMDQIRKGQPYAMLKNSYVIFLCAFDLFGQNEPIYFFENYDVKNGLKLGDKTYKIMVNTRCTKPDLPKELRTLFDYINDNELDESDDLLRSIDRQVSIINREDSDWRREAMWSREKYKIWELNRELEAVEKGRAEEKNIIARNLKNSGVPIDVITKNTGLTEEEVEAL